MKALRRGSMKSLKHLLICQRHCGSGLDRDFVPNITSPYHSTASIVGQA